MKICEKKNFITNFIFLAICLITVFMLLRLTTAYLFPFVIGAFIAYSVQKPAKFLSKKMPLKQQSCAALLSVLFFLLIIFAIALLFWVIYSRLSIFINDLSSNNLGNYIEEIYYAFRNFFDSGDTYFGVTIKNLITDTLNNLMIKLSAFLSDLVTKSAKSVPNLLISCIITIVSTFYISKDYDRLVRFFKGFIKNDFIKNADKIRQIFLHCAKRFVFGYFMIFIITFAELTIGFSALKIKQFLLLALLVALIDVLPVLGTGTVLLPWAAVMFIKAEYIFGIRLVVLYILIVVVRNFIEPKIIGKQIGINPIFTLIFLFLGYKLGGIIGMLIFPFVLTIVFTYYREKFSTDNTNHSA